VTEINAEDVYKDLNISKILIAALEVLGEIDIPALTFLDAAQKDRELQVDYNSDNQLFTFKLKDNNEQSDNNTDTE
jgi:hypothetical protein